MTDSGIKLTLNKLPRCISHSLRCILHSLLCLAALCEILDHIFCRQYFKCNHSTWQQSYFRLVYCVNRCFCWSRNSLNYQTNKKPVTWSGAFMCPLKTTWVQLTWITVQHFAAHRFHPLKWISFNWPGSHCIRITIHDTVKMSLWFVCMFKVWVRVWSELSQQPLGRSRVIDSSQGVNDHTNYVRILYSSTETQRPRSCSWKILELLLCVTEA